MRYQLLAEAYARIEAAASRLEMTRLLADLLRHTPRGLIGPVVYLTQGKLRPEFEGIEIGIAEKLAVRAVAQSTGLAPETIQRHLGRTGDLGSVAEAQLAKSRRRSTLTVDEVYRHLEHAARAGGTGAQAAKLRAIAALLSRATPLEARYVVRTVTGKLRLGVGDMTLLYALAAVHGNGRTARRELERAYNLTSDLGYVAATVAAGGLSAVRKTRVATGKPIRPMLAERLGDPGEILAKFGGRCVAEYKYDGERLQIHKKGTQVELFSRRLEKITPQYPDVAGLVGRHVKARDAIIEGEVVAIDATGGDLLPFQELMRRRRKHGIEETMTKVPTALYAFDALYADGKDLTEHAYDDRHHALARMVKTNDRFRLANHRVVDSVEDLEAFFEQAVGDGCEGLVCKAPGGVYQAGARGWQWIKFKREYRSEMTDAVDLVVVAAFHGRGRRGGMYGALLMAAYDPRADTFRTVCKLGSGFTDELLATLPNRLRRHARPSPHRRVDSRLRADVWFEPALVCEVIGAEITLSPVHSAGWDAVRKGSGLAIRFPRLTRVRDDKSPTDATTVQEIVEMYRRRLRAAGR
jgi:DNA ligase-1